MSSVKGRAPSGWTTSASSEDLSEGASILKANPLPWLLERDNPSVRYLALTEIMGLPDSHPEAAEAKAAIMESGTVPEILGRQSKGGYWEGRQDFYERAKYRGTVWQLITLAELGSDGNDRRVKKACEFVLKISQDAQSGGFCYRGSLPGGGEYDCVIPCLTGNMVWSLLRFGYSGDPRLERGINWLTTYRRFDDGEGASPKGWPYTKREPCWGKHTCLMGVVKSLKALAEIPEERRSAGVSQAIAEGAEYLLRHHLFKRSHDLTQPARKQWLKFGFPTMWDSDALEVLLLLARLGYRDRRMREAAELVLAKQDSQGRWLLEDTFNGRTLINIERKGRPSKWVTLSAIRALRAYFVQGKPLHHDPA
jgi:hypothetical protein